LPGIPDLPWSRRPARLAITTVPEITPAPESPENSTKISFPLFPIFPYFFPKFSQFFLLLFILFPPFSFSLFPFYFSFFLFLFYFSLFLTVCTVAPCSNAASPQPCTARARLRLCSAAPPLPASAQHIDPSSAARRADTPRSDRSMPLDDTAAIKTRLPVPSLRAPALPQDAARLVPATSPATASLPDESHPQHRCRSRPVGCHYCKLAGPPLL
jgi:hypothetical protein